MDGGQADVCQAIPFERINRVQNYQQQFVHKKFTLLTSRSRSRKLIIVVEQHKHRIYFQKINYKKWLILVLQAWIRDQVKFFVHNVRRCQTAKCSLSVRTSVKPVVRKNFQKSSCQFKIKNQKNDIKQVSH